MRSNYILIALLFLTACSKTQTVKYPLLQTALSTRYQWNEVISLRPAKDHHFNLQAPNACGNGNWLEKSPLLMRCQLTQAGEQKFTFSVCDNANTFCQQVQHTAKVNAKSGAKTAAPLPENAKKAHISPTGFLHNEPERALAEAKEKNQLLLIDFYGIWCPPCNRLDETVFSKKEFQAATKSIIKIQLDADAPISFAWKEKFKVSGYPTVILANSKLEEIDRMVGNRSLSGTISWIEKNQKLSAIQSLISKENPSADESIRLAKYFQERREIDSALQALLNQKNWTNSQARAAARIKAEIQLEIAKNQSDINVTKKAYENLISLYPQAIEYSDWVDALTQIDPQAGKKYIEAAQKNLAKHQANPKLLADIGYSLGDTWMMRANLWELVEKEKEAKAAYAQAAKAYLAESRESSYEVARGANIDLAEALRLSGDLEAANSLYKKLISTYGKEFTFNYGYANLLLETKKIPEALNFAKAALEYSYGDNFLRAATLKAKIETKLGDKKSAESTLIMALEKYQAPDEANVRSHTYVARLRNQLADLKQK